MTITYITTYNGTTANIEVRRQQEQQRNLAFYKTIFQDHLGLKNIKPKMGMQGMKTRRVMKMEKPRPLKISTLGDQSMESVLNEMDLVSQQLNSGTWDRTLYSSIASLCENLKMFGPQLENVYKDQLDKCFISFRNGCRDDRLSLSARYRLLEVIEVRAMHWQPNENLINYYKQKLAQFEAEEAVMEEQVDITGGYMTPGNVMTPTSGTTQLFPGQVPQYQQQLLYTQQQLQQQQQQIIPPQQPATPTLLAPGEIIKSSGKFPKPTRIPGKNYCKDEVVIRNADSGKVMGIKGRRVHMIEELSETIISFQRVAPGARERLVQITGPNEENIAQAKQLIEETIRRNASPVRNEDRSSIYTSLGGSSSSISSHNSDETLQGSKRNTLIHSTSMTEEPMQEYRYTVTNGQDAIRITGNNLNLVRTAKLVLDEFFNGERNFNNIAMLLTPESKNGNNDTSSNTESSPQSHGSQTTGRTSPGKASSPKSSTSTSDAGETQQSEAPKSGVVTVTRQPLIPSSSKEAIESVENDSQSGNESAKNRRAMFAKTSEDRSSTEDDEVLVTPTRRVYTREFLVKCSASPLARRTPENWSKVVQQNPAILKKNWLYLPAVVATLTKSGETALDSTTSYLKTNDMVDPKDLIRGVLEINWSNVRTYSTTEEDDNGNATTLAVHERRASHSS